MIREVRNLIIQIIEEIKYSLIDTYSRLFRLKHFLSYKSKKLHLGCGGILKKGFINIDRRSPAQLRLDLRKKLPFKSNSVDYIYSEHFFEHLDYIDGTAIKCLQDYLRVLKKGGKIRIVIPDMEKSFKAYVNRDYDYFKMLDLEDYIPQSKKYGSIIDFINWGVYQRGEHKYNYDFEKISLLLKSVGFKNIRRDNFDPEKDFVRKNAKFDPKDVSLYIEAMKE